MRRAGSLAVRTLGRNRAIAKPSTTMTTRAETSRCPSDAEWSLPRGTGVRVATVSLKELNNVRVKNGSERTFSFFSPQWRDEGVRDKGSNVLCFVVSIWPIFEPPWDAALRGSSGD